MPAPDTDRPARLDPRMARAGVAALIPGAMAPSTVSRDSSQRVFGAAGCCGAAIAAGGLIAVLVGSFLPWLSSGGVLRNSYEIAGIAGRIGLVGAGLGARALSLWPFLGPLVMVTLAAGLLRWWRTAAAIALLCGVLTGAIGGAALAAAGGPQAAGIALDHTGPMVSVVGAAAVLAGAVVVLLFRRRATSPAVPWPDRVNQAAFSARPSIGNRGSCSTAGTAAKGNARP